MAQQGEVFPLKSGGAAGTVWAFRYRAGGRDSKRVQRGGFRPTAPLCKRWTDRLSPARAASALLFPAPEGGYLDPLDEV
jgi:hypothetical protein